MKYEKIDQLPQAKVVDRYKCDASFSRQYFDYPNEANGFAARLETLKGRTFNRSELQRIIRSFMEPFGISKAAETHLRQLEDEHAVMIVGGQQAGILTGPLYSVHKAITVILQAKEQTEKLGVPVIPVFWVAGEDHDLNEINHVYSETNGQLRKEQIADAFILKDMASVANYDTDNMIRLIEDVFAKFGETAYTKGLLSHIKQAAKEENTFTTFFVRLMNELFEKAGMLFIDAADPLLRKLETPYFKQMINRAPEIAKLVHRAEATFEAEGFGKPIHVEEDAAHLFYVHETGRILLSLKEGWFVNESAGLKFSTDELQEIAEQSPEKLSNNVVTRPIMQDLVLPVLGFVGGAGELAYWAVLKSAFHEFGIDMPVFIPRMSITLVTPSAAKILRDESFTVQDVVEGEASKRKAKLFEKLQDETFKTTIDGMFTKLADEYKELAHEHADDKTLHQLIEQNIQYHEQQFTYLKEKYEDRIYSKYQRQLEKFDVLEVQLYPMGQLQERIFHPYYFINLYGPSLIEHLLALPLDSNGNHYLVYL